MKEVKRNHVTCNTCKQKVLFPCRKEKDQKNCPNNHDHEFRFTGIVSVLNETEKMVCQCGAEKWVRIHGL